MRDIEIKTGKLLFPLLFLGAFFVLLSALDFNRWQILNIIGFPYLVFVPGLLSLLIFKIRNSELWGFFGLAIGLSLLELMLMALIGNQILPYLGISAPLEKPVLLALFSALILSLSAWLWSRQKTISLSIRPWLIFDSRKDLLVALLPLVFVIMSVLGAIRLNNGASGILTAIMIGGIALYSLYLIKENKKLGPNVIPLALFFFALSFLFMTSLRGLYITGHDVQREYMVFELAKNHGLWDIDLFKNSYNACLSITLLPTLLFKLLHFFDPNVYKIFFQILFAIVPSIIYLFSKRYVSPLIAFVASLYFISFPTFFGDMPMLNRQEIAFLFLALMIFSIFEKEWPLPTRRWLFTLFGFGLIFSHYSTTYTVIAILIFILVARFIVRKLTRYRFYQRLFADSAIRELRNEDQPNKYLISVPIVILLGFSSFFWSGIVTDTASGSLYKVLAETIEAIKDNAKEEARSSDILYSLFSWKRPNPEQVLGFFNEEIVDPLRANAPDSFYSDPIKENYPIQILSSDNTPLTALGQRLQNRGLAVESFNYYFRQSSAKLLQVFIAFGFIFALFRRRYLKEMDDEFIYFGAGSLLFILAQILLPVLSVEYGVLRAFQQSLMFLGIFLVTGSMTLFFFLKERAKQVVASLLGITFLLSSTGFIIYTLGGYPAQLHLYNDGTYYDLYYAHESEVQSLAWLEKELKNIDPEIFQSNIQIDTYTSTKIRFINEIGIIDGIYPGLIRKNSYVFLSYANTKKKKATIYHNSDMINYAYPLDFLNDNKNRLYDNSGSSIYR